MNQTVEGLEALHLYTCEVLARVLSWMLLHLTDCVSFG